MSRTRSPAVRSLVLALRLVGAVLLAATAGIHRYLWVAGYRDIPTIGPLFLVNVVAGGVLCLAVLAAPWRWLATVAVLAPAPRRRIPPSRPARADRAGAGRLTEMAVPVRR